MGKIALGRGAKFLERGEGFYPMRVKDYEIVLGALRDVAEYFGFHTRMDLDAHLTSLFVTDDTGMSGFAKLFPPRKA